MVRHVLRELDARAAPKQTTPIRLDDLRRMVGAIAPTGHAIKIRAAFLVLYAGALRVSELAALTWDKVGSDGGNLVLQIRRKRHAEWCEVHLLAAADEGLCPVRALTQLRHAEALMFRMREPSPIFAPARTIQGWVAALATRAGLPGVVSPHSLRHGWASDAASAGIPLPAIQKHLGHSSSVMTSHYASHAALRRFY
jgi:integrase/recombinase XerD